MDKATGIGVAKSPPEDWRAALGRYVRLFVRPIPTWNLALNLSGVAVTVPGISATLLTIGPELALIWFLFALLLLAVWAGVALERELRGDHGIDIGLYDGGNGEWRLNVFNHGPKAEFEAKVRRNSKDPYGPVWNIPWFSVPSYKVDIIKGSAHPLLLLRGASFIRREDGEHWRLAFPQVGGDERYCNRENVKAPDGQHDPSWNLDPMILEVEINRITTGTRMRVKLEVTFNEEADTSTPMVRLLERS